MGFFKEFIKGAKEGIKSGSERADREIAEKRAKEVERNSPEAVRERLELGKLAAEGRIKQSIKTDED